MTVSYMAKTLQLYISIFYADHNLMIFNEWSKQYINVATGFMPGYEVS